MTRQDTTDSAFMGPWLANNIRECDGMTTMMSYWSFSDVFEEQGVVKTPFYGGYGLIAERSIPKPAFNAFELLHQLGEQRLENKSENVLVTKRPNGAIVLAMWNYADPGQSGPVKSFRLDVKGTTATAYRLQVADPQHGSSLQKWLAMRSPVSPTTDQIEQLRKAAVMPPPTRQAINKPIELPAHALALVELIQ
jgi:xylan 1,4-beta-xylosidase